MNPEIIKSKTDFRKYLASLLVLGLIFGLDILGFSAEVNSRLDQIFIPSVILIRNNGMYINLLVEELSNRPYLARENLELKKQIAEYEQIRVENERLKKQIESLSQENNIKLPKQPSLVAVEVFGIQDLYSVNPRVRIIIPKNVKIQKWDPVYIDRMTLLGFITEINGSTAVVSPFFSANISFSIPVQSVSNSTIKGFVSKNNSAEIIIRNVQKDVVIPIGDIWVTTNDVSEVPPGLIIGKVKAIKDDIDSGFQEIVLTPAVDFTFLNIVYLRDE
ncbi:MAG: hypothetical protein KatS3mg083_473 [Candidatus Dojkabacteria bacterium]|nr:MAG: hypothetical protein KatS3mg083_473 [Candidatus Dojkabacteria bacterium]